MLGLSQEELKKLQKKAEEARKRAKKKAEAEAKAKAEALKKSEEAFKRSRNKKVESEKAQIAKGTSKRPIPKQPTYQGVLNLEALGIPTEEKPSRTKPPVFTPIREDEPIFPGPSTPDLQESAAQASSIADGYSQSQSYKDDITKDIEAARRSANVRSKMDDRASQFTPKVTDKKKRRAEENKKKLLAENQLILDSEKVKQDKEADKQRMIRERQGILDGADRYTNRSNSADKARVVAEAEAARIADEKEAQRISDGNAQFLGRVNRNKILGGADQYLADEKENENIVRSAQQESQMFEADKRRVPAPYINPDDRRKVLPGEIEDSRTRQNLLRYGRQTPKGVLSGTDPVDLTTQSDNKLTRDEKKLEEKTSSVIEGIKRKRRNGQKLTQEELLTLAEHNNPQFAKPADTTKEVDPFTLSPKERLKLKKEKEAEAERKKNSYTGTIRDVDGNVITDPTPAQIKQSKARDAKILEEQEAAYQRDNKRFDQIERNKELLKEIEAEKESFIEKYGPVEGPKIYAQRKKSLEEARDNVNYNMPHSRDIGKRVDPKTLTPEYIREQFGVNPYDDEAVLKGSSHAPASFYVDKIKNKNIELHGDPDADPDARRESDAAAREKAVAGALSTANVGEPEVAVDPTTASSREDAEKVDKEVDGSVIDTTTTISNKPKVTEKPVLDAEGNVDTSYVNSPEIGNLAATVTDPDHPNKAKEVTSSVNPEAAADAGFAKMGDHDEFFAGDWEADNHWPQTALRFFVNLLGGQGLAHAFNEANSYYTSQVDMDERMEYADELRDTYTDHSIKMWIESGDRNDLITHAQRKQEENALKIQEGTITKSGYEIEALIRENTPESLARAEKLAKIELESAGFNLESAKESLRMKRDKHAMEIKKAASKSGGDYNVQAAALLMTMTEEDREIANQYISEWDSAKYTFMENLPSAMGAGDAAFDMYSNMSHAGQVYAKRKVLTEELSRNLSGAAIGQVERKELINLLYPKPGQRFTPGELERSNAIIALGQEASFYKKSGQPGKIRHIPLAVFHGVKNGDYLVQYENGIISEVIDARNGVPLDRNQLNQMAMDEM